MSSQAQFARLIGYTVRTHRDSGASEVDFWLARFPNAYELAEHFAAQRRTEDPSARVEVKPIFGHMVQIDPNGAYAIPVDMEDDKRMMDAAGTYPSPATTSP